MTAVVLKRSAAAARHLAHCMRIQPLSSKPEQIARAKRDFEAEKAKVGTLRIDGPEGTKVSIDGTAAGMIGQKDPFFVEPGLHEITGTLPNHKGKPESVRVEAGDEKTVKLSLVPTGGGGAGGEGGGGSGGGGAGGGEGGGSSFPKTKPEDRQSMERVRDEAKKHVALVRLVVSPADAHVVLDGKPLAARVIVRDPGPIDLRVTAAGRPARVVTRTLEAGDDLEITLALGEVTGPDGNAAGAARPISWKTPVAASAISLGAAGLVVGAVLMGLSVSRDKDGDALRDDLVKTGLCPTVDPTRCEQLLGIRREQDLFWNVGLPTLITGGVLAVGGVVVAVVPLRPSPKPAVSVDVRAGVSGALVRGRF